MQTEKSINWKRINLEIMNNKIALTEYKKRFLDVTSPQTCYGIPKNIPLHPLSAGKFKQNCEVIHQK